MTTARSAAAVISWIMRYLGVVYRVIDQLAAGRLLVMPAEEHDNAPPDDVELSPLLAEGTAEPSAREPPLASAAAHLHHRHLYVSEVLDSRNEEKRNERIE
ncbi:hypothetical protein SAY86_009039 [Trapa natans]|uniref:Uncharacterized protein n=1 Tax=Trapa natans TaxID=22666 RepID=A0AAN7KAK7_TRANT|nr:hypothetical protein SAY86_009039 [Trapa natans]